MELDEAGGGDGGVLVLGDDQLDGAGRRLEERHEGLVEFAMSASMIWRFVELGKGLQVL